MNIFFLDKDPKKCVDHYYDSHVCKMVIETAQMLCTAHHLLGNSNVPYRKTHYNHPSTIWVRSSKKHYEWAYQLMIAIGEEFTKRYGKQHLTITKCKDILKEIPKGIINDDWVDPPQCMPDEYKADNSLDAYWNFYKIGKKHLAKHNKVKV
jgi:hypothetical protein